MTRSQKQKAYRQAAELIADEQRLYCCTALEAVTGNDRLVDEFAEYFKPASKSRGGPWFPDPGDWLDGIDHKAQSQRILALLFMSHITE